MIRDLIVVDRLVPPAVWGILCIDIWDDNGSNDRFYQRAIAKLSQYNIGLVVNCTNSLKIDYNDKSVYNTFKKYVWNLNLEDPTNGDVYQQVQRDMLKFSGERPVSRVLNEKLFNDHSIFLNNKDTFLYHTAKYYPEITDWIMLGSAWKICLHNSPLGVGHILPLIMHKFHIFPDWSIQNEDLTPVSVHQVDDDEFVWSSVGNGGYRLVTKMGGTWTRR